MDNEVKEYHFINIPKRLAVEKGGFSLGVYLAVKHQDTLPSTDSLPDMVQDLSDVQRLRIHLNTEDSRLFEWLAQSKYKGNKSLTARVVLDVLRQQPFHAGRHDYL